MSNAPTTDMPTADMTLGVMVDRYRYCHERLLELDDALEEWKARYEHATAIQYDAVHSEPSDRDIQFYAILRKDEIVSEQRTLLAEKRELKEHIETALLQVKEYPQATIARRYYLDITPKRDISERMGYTYRYVDKLIHQVNRELGIEPPEKR